MYAGELLSGAGPGIAAIVVDDDRRCLEASAGACALLGVKRADAIGRSLDDLLAPEMAPLLGAFWAAFAESGGHAGPFEPRSGDAAAAAIELSVRLVAPGRHVIALAPAVPRAAGAVAAGHRHNGAPDVRLPTRRELEILSLVATGRSDREIAERLKLSPATVQTHVRNVKRKLGVRTRAQAVATAVRDGIIQLA